MASRKTEEMKQRLLQEREALLRQRDAIDNEIKGIERAIQLVSADQVDPIQGGKKPQTKAIVLELLDEVGTTGLDAATAVRLADEKGQTVEKGSVSSLLSRLKKDGVVQYDGSRYRLPKYVKKHDEDDAFALRVFSSSRSS